MNHLFKQRPNPYPDLKAKMDELKLYMYVLDCWKVGTFRANIERRFGFEISNHASHKETIDRCNVNGLAVFLGEGNYGVAIRGSVQFKGRSVKLFSSENHI
jgi:hypothetical protein